MTTPDDFVPLTHLTRIDDNTLTLDVVVHVPAEKKLEKLTPIPQKVGNTIMVQYNATGDTSLKDPYYYHEQFTLEIGGRFANVETTVTHNPTRSSSDSSDRAEPPQG
jgi:hypothetical protein